MRPTPRPLPPCHAARLTLAGLALASLLAAPPAPAAAPAPWPADWPIARPPAQDDPPSGQDTWPRWGVPAVAVPQAETCGGPLRSRELPGPRMMQAARDEAAETAATLGKAAPSRLGADAAPMAQATAPATAAERTAAPPQAPRRSPVTAGVVDDNADFGAYLAYRERSADLDPRSRDIAERYRVEVRDRDDRPVPDAELALTWPGAPHALVWARTDAGGTAWLHPGALLAPGPRQRLDAATVLVRAPRAWGGGVSTAEWRRGQKASIALRVERRLAAAPRPRLDLAFVIDATGSMGDEIAKLKASVHDIAARIGALPSAPEVCLGLVAYRDQGDAFVLRTQDFTDSLGSFQRGLSRLAAAGGGDEPESMNSALHEAVHRLSWRAQATRLVVLLADAPPQPPGVDPAPPHDHAAAAALARGIKLNSVGASGLSPEGEATLRHLAQATGGRFVFLTYRDAHDPASGPGRETVHDVQGYSVQTLDDLVVRLVREELARGG